MITIKSLEEIEVMEEGGKILAMIMKKLLEEVKPNVKGDYLNDLAKKLILENNALPSFENYDGFPATLCLSINEVIVHGIPFNVILNEGDIVSLDLGLFYKGFHSDMAVTCGVGKISLEKQKLIKATKNTLNKTIENIKPGLKFYEIGKFIEKYAKEQGFNVIKELCGHGIGRKLHEDPLILNFFNKDDGNETIKNGMTFCIEPMLTKGDWRIKRAKDGYGFRTRDNSLSAHFEHTIAIKNNRVKILTVL
ncbi:MAG: type I methionyl aminopeptidase [Candidatus Pacebacteria bacterium]|nr:type I methionyl aminopeptidase [Candidatus Paceibacterota bacterium]HOL90173.1 type I methionyl aminopeptidase [Candidatus Pacearchaeota archaeon]HOW12710.1 type I methionyl aminopeptidase [Candidatus Pacearchaeota archaeon]